MKKSAIPADFAAKVKNIHHTAYLDLVIELIQYLKHKERIPAILIMLHSGKKGDVMRTLRYGVGLLLGLICSAAQALSIHPVVTLGLGSDSTTDRTSQNITLFAPFQNTYYGNYNDIQTIGNVFLGGEIQFMDKWAWQLGASYYQNITPFTPNGTVYQFADVNFGNLNYNFNVQSRRYLAETKLLYAFNEKFHPYVQGGIGRANNRSYGYTEVPITSADVPMQTAFANKTVNSFTYSVGLGLEMDMTKNLRFGIGYNYVKLGSAGLGVVSGQESTDTIKLNNFNTNEVMLHFSYVG